MTWSPRVTLVTPGADVDHDARPFVAEDRGKEPLGIGARAGELVGVADAGRLDLDEHLACARPFELDLLDDEGLSGFVGHGGTGFHGPSSMDLVRMASSAKTERPAWPVHA